MDHSTMGNVLGIANAKFSVHRMHSTESKRKTIQLVNDFSGKPCACVGNNE